MRPSDRLFQIIQILRRTPKPITADALAAELETSKRTVYRDIADLIAQRVPIRGEAGIGYVLQPGLDLPPLMLTPDEIEAAVLGAQWVARHSDAELARAAQDLIAKIGAVVPERLRPFVFEPVTDMPPARSLATDGVDMARVRAQIHAGLKIIWKRLAKEAGKRGKKAGNCGEIPSKMRGKKAGKGWEMNGIFHPHRIY